MRDDSTSRGGGAEPHPADVHAPSDAALAVCAGLQRICMLGHLLCIGTHFDGVRLTLSPESLGGTPPSGWSAGAITRADTAPVPGGLTCPTIFPATELRRLGHIELGRPVVPWPAWPLLSRLLATPVPSLREALHESPRRFGDRLAEAGQRGQTVLGLPPASLLWGAVPVIHPTLRAWQRPGARQPLSLDAGYRQVLHHAGRLSRFRAMSAPEVLLAGEHAILSAAVDRLLARAELPPVAADGVTGEAGEASDAAELLLQALVAAPLDPSGPAAAPSWHRAAAEIAARVEPTGRSTALLLLAAERPSELLDLRRLS